MKLVCGVLRVKVRKGPRKVARRDNPTKKTDVTREVREKQESLDL